MGHEDQHHSRTQHFKSGDGLISVVTAPGWLFSSALKEKNGLFIYLFICVCVSVFCSKSHDQNCLAAEECHGSVAEKTDRFFFRM